jgi:hypothetical protein
MKPILTLTLAFFLLANTVVYAGAVSGTITDDKGAPLAYASLLVKGTTKGTTANNQGKYTLELEPGNYVIICQYVGYARQEKAVVMGREAMTADFSLLPLQTTIKEVIVTSGGEDPAYEIIRNTIKKRPQYLEPLDSFTCEAYIKTLMKTRKLPKRILGQKIDASDKKEMGVDSTGKGIIHLSESLTKIAFKKPEQVKLEVLSGRESGGGGYGFNFPTFINFYENNVNVMLTQLAPRGFVSPIADGALNYYKYKYSGSFWEDGKEISRIKVIPRRKYEPLFSGIINITEGDWRIHSLELTLTKESQLQLLDTLQIKQIQVPVTTNVWQPKDQVLYFTFNILGIDAVGHSLNVYNKYDTKPQFKKKYFNNVIVAYDTAVNKKTKQYWDSIRPVQLEPEEQKDYTIKDSLYHIEHDSTRSKAVRDSLRHNQGRITPGRIFWKGFSRSDYNQQRPLTFTWKPVLKQLQYNTAEGLAVNMEATVQKYWRSSQRRISFTPHLRYGLNNTHLNAWGSVFFSKGARGIDNPALLTGSNSWSLAGGKRVSQFNNQEPIMPLLNSIYTLLEHRNYLKFYENYFGELRYQKRFENDLRITGSFLYEDRIPVDNTTDYSFFKKDRVFTPNYPFEQLAEQFTRHQAVIVGVEMQYQPGQRYIQFPRRKVAIGSEYPTLALSYAKGIENLLGSDVNFDKWRFAVWDDVNFKLKGLLKYRVNIGGFLNNDKVAIQDYQHFNGNQLLLASEYLNSFQLAPYYANSTTTSFYATAHVEHHFNGMLTNKIPLFKKLNWFLVAGSSAFYVNSNNNYIEAFAGIENIFKLLRVDLVTSYLNGNKGVTGVRLGFGGLLGGSFRMK